MSYGNYVNMSQTQPERRSARGKAREDSPGKTGNKENSTKRSGEKEEDISLLQRLDLITSEITKLNVKFDDRIAEEFSRLKEMLEENEKCNRDTITRLTDTINHSHHALAHFASHRCSPSSIPGLGRGCMCEKFHQLLAIGRWFPPGTPVSSTRKLISSSSFYRLDMTLAVAEALNPNKPNHQPSS